MLGKCWGGSPDNNAPAAGRRQSVARNARHATGNASSRLVSVSDYHPAQINVGASRATIDDPPVAECADALEEINALADKGPDFVWRLQTEQCNASGTHTSRDEPFTINKSVWETADDLSQYVCRTERVGSLRNRRGCFDRMDELHVSMWWIKAGQVPSIDEGMAGLDRSRRNGAAAQAFSLRKPFEPAPAGR